jgi:hypothetical protein
MHHHNTNLHILQGCTGPATSPATIARKPYADLYPCTRCAEHISRSGDRATHMRVAHSIERVRLCHECLATFTNVRLSVRRLNNYGRSRGTVQTLCSVLRCQSTSPSREVSGRHRRDDHHEDGSFKAQCTDCDYSNNSVVGCSVHMLHVHSAEG